MRLLFAISVVSFCTVLWLALSLVRRIRRVRTVPASPAARPTAMEFFEAGEFRTPRALRLNQDVTNSVARTNLEDTAAVSAPSRTPMLQPLLPSTPRIVPLQVPPGEAATHEAVVIDSKLHFILPEPVRPVETLRHDTAQRDISGERKSPQSARSGTFRRVDLSHYNSDMGDLTDPYTHSPRGAGVRPSLEKNA